MEIVAGKEKIKLQLAYWIDDEPDEERQEQERTAAKKRLFIEYLEATGGRISAVAQKIDIHRSTYYVWRNADPEFAAKVDEILEDQPLRVEESLFTQALSGNVSAQKFYLSRKHADYKKKAADGPNEVHIYHHTDKKEGEGKIITFEDLIDDPALHMIYLQYKEKFEGREDGGMSDVADELRERSDKRNQ